MTAHQLFHRVAWLNDQMSLFADWNPEVTCP